MIDVVALVRDVTIRETLIRQTFAERVYGGHLPPQKTAADMPMLEIRQRGGRLDYSSRVYQVSMQFKAYGATEQAAMTAGRSVVDALNDKQHVHNTVLWSRLEEGTMPTTLQEPDTGWWFCLVFIRFFIKEL